MNEADQQVYGELVPHNRDPYNNNDFLKVCERFITHVWVHLSMNIAVIRQLLR